MFDLPQKLVQGLQLLILLTNTEHPLVKDVVLVTQPLHLEVCLDGLLLIRVQTCTLCFHDAAGVVLQAEQVLGILHHQCPLGVELLSGAVTSSLQVLTPRGLIQILDWAQCDGHVSRVREALFTQLGTPCGLSS
jgi:hypothetical protein